MPREITLKNASKRFKGLWSGRRKKKKTPPEKGLTTRWAKPATDYNLRKRVTDFAHNTVIRGKMLAVRLHITVLYILFIFSLHFYFFNTKPEMPFKLLHLY